MTARSDVGTIVRIVKNSRNGRRPTAAVAQRAEQRRHQRVDPDADRDRDADDELPGPWPNRLSSVSHSPIAVDTTA